MSIGRTLSAVHWHLAGISHIGLVLGDDLAEAFEYARTRADERLGAAFLGLLGFAAGTTAVRQLCQFVEPG